MIDTAGIRENAEEIEALGIERSKDQIRKATIVICMADGQNPDEVESTRRWKEELQSEYLDKNVLFVINKSDLKSYDNDDLQISAKEGINIDLLQQRIVDEVKGEFDLSEDTIVSNARHYDALINTSEALQKALEGLVTGVTGDFVAMDIRQAMFELGTITGDISTDDLLGNIFAKFCIGK